MRWSPLVERNVGTIVPYSSCESQTWSLRYTWTSSSTVHDKSEELSRIISCRSPGWIIEKLMQHCTSLV